jgi:hypothetical protein
VSRPACGQAARPQCSLRESDGESAPTANRLAESFHTYSGSTALGNFEIGSSQILTDGERGLLGLAFDPAFASNGFFYVNLINMSGDTEIRRYHVSANPNVDETARNKKYWTTTRRT